MNKANARSAVNPAFASFIQLFVQQVVQDLKELTVSEARVFMRVSQTA